MPALTAQPSPAANAAEKLRQDILQGLEKKRFKHGDKIISERKLADQMGVSYMTARKILTQLVSDGLLERRAGKGVFVRSVSRRGASKKLTCVRGLFYLELFSSFYAQMAGALTRVLYEAGVEIVWSTAAELTRPDLRERLRGWKENAFIVVGQMPHALIDALREAGKPLTIIDHCYEGLDADHAVLDNEGVGFAAAERLVAMGKQRVAYLGGAIDRGHPYFDPRRRSEWPNSILRGMGVRRSYLTRGMTPDEKHFRTFEDSNGICALIAEWCDASLKKTGVAPDAIICFSPYAAARAIQEFEARGVPVPRDIALIGIGTPPEWSGARRTLAHFDVDWPALGREAARLCLLRQQEPLAPPRRVLLPWLYVSGESAELGR
jgi:DNA-binding LacI/PurR family transcriptional regulator